MCVIKIVSTHIIGPEFGIFTRCLLLERELLNDWYVRGVDGNLNFNWEHVLIGK